jgi:glutamyl-tRNA reductase
VEGLALIGISHRRGGLERLERWREAGAEGWLDRLDRLGVTSRVLLDTCNRWDVVVDAPSELLGALRAPLAETGGATLAYTYRGEAAVEQLIRVTAALDSLNPGESQITAQVRRAYAEAEAHGATNRELHFAFQTALRAAKRVRHELDLTAGETSLFSLAKPQLARTLQPGDQVVVIGAGEMGTAAARSVARDGNYRVLIVNRTVARADELAAELGAESRALNDFMAAPPPAAAIVSALRGGGLLGRELLTRMPTLQLIVDLGGPRNFADGTVSPGVRYVQVADLEAAGAERRAQLMEKLALAERIVMKEAAAAAEEWLERQLGPAIARLRAHYQDRVAEALPPERAAGLASRLARLPINGLRAVARRYGPEAAQVFIEEAGI